MTYASLSFGGFPGMGDKRSPLPRVSLTFDGSDVCIMKANKELLKKAPGFEPSDWPDMSDPTRRSKIYKYQKNRFRGKGGAIGPLFLYLRCLFIFQLPDGSESSDSFFTQFAPVHQ